MAQKTMIAVAVMKTRPKIDEFLRRCNFRFIFAYYEFCNTKYFTTKIRNKALPAALELTKHQLKFNYFSDKRQHTEVWSKYFYCHRSRSIDPNDGFSLHYCAEKNQQNRTNKSHSSFSANNHSPLCKQKRNQ